MSICHRLTLVVLLLYEKHALLTGLFDFPYQNNIKIRCHNLEFLFMLYLVFLPAVLYMCNCN